MTEPTPWRYATHYDPEVEREVRLVADHEVTADQVAAAGYGVPPEIARLWLAEEVVQRRIETREKLRKAERQQRQQPEPQAAPGGRHPSAQRWAKWGNPANISDATPAYQEFVRTWEQKRARIRVYRPELPDEAVSSISDCRKLFRDAQIETNFLQAMILFTFEEAGRKLAELRSRITELEARTRKMTEYKGLWSADQAYDEAALVTSGGSIWIATVRVKGVKPGEGTCWQLAAKKGRDGRHYREEKDATT